MRIRSIKPEFWRSSDISSLDWEARLLFIGLWSYVDDNGVGLDKLASITADLFADDLERDSSETFARVSRGLQTLTEAERIVRYEVAGKKFLSITNWEKHQRIDKPNKPRYPRNDAENVTIRDAFATSSRDSRESPATGTGEQRNRGTEEQRTVPGPALDIPADTEALAKASVTRQIAEDFEAWYAVYPKHEGKKPAGMAYAKARKNGATAEALLSGVRRYAAERKGQDPKFTAYPASWLNQERWTDETQTTSAAASSPWTHDFHRQQSVDDN